MTITLIGAGNLATNLGHALCAAGHDISQVYSRTQKAAATLAAMLCATPVTDIMHIAPGADVYIVSVADDALAAVADGLTRHLCNHQEAAGRVPLIVHTAGSIPMTAIPCSRRGVFYPMQTFSKRRLVDFSAIPIFVEAEHDDDLGRLMQLAQSITEHVVQLNSADRRYLHLAAVFCSNFTNHCYTLASQILSQHGIPFDTMLPLIDEVAEKVHHMPPAEAQTGPARRNDQGVMQAQLNLLTDNPTARQVYEVMSHSILKTS